MGRAEGAFVLPVMFRKPAMKIYPYYLYIFIFKMTEIKHIKIVAVIIFSGENWLMYIKILHF